MRILIAGANSSYAIERFFVRYLNEEPGIMSELFEAQNLFLAYYQKSIFTKILFRLGYKNIYKVINKKLRNKITEWNPDVLFVFKGMEILPETLSWARARGIKLVNYNPDNPFIFSGRGSGNVNVTRSVPLYHLHLTYNSEVKDIMDHKYQIPAVVLPFGFDVDENTYNNCCKLIEIKKLCFVGNPDKYRADFITSLAKAGISIDVYGNHWSRYLNHPCISIFSMVSGDEFWETLHKYRIQLNLMRPHNLTTHNMRSIEIAGIGGIQLAPETKDHLAYFVPNKEIFTYRNLEECKSRINYLLGMTFEESSQIRLAARNRAVLSGYSYKHRVKDALNTIKAICQ